MNDSFEGDLIRPLGLVTLNFGYVEAQVNTLMDMLQDCGLSFDHLSGAPLGLRLLEFAKVVRELRCAEVGEVVGLLEESKSLIGRRNDLVHASVLAGGRVIPNDPSKPEFSVTPEELTALAKRAFNWKERLNSAVQMRLLPALREERTRSQTRLNDICRV